MFPLLVGVYLMTFISLVPYIFVNVVIALKNRNDSRWIVTVGLSVALFASLVAAMAKLAHIRDIVSPFAISQLKFDSTLALSLALLGLSTLIYLNGVMPEGRRLVKTVFSIIEGEKDDDVEVV
ncbi:MAG: hypothetical protein ACK4SY_09380 [Pyrobaculum sp.]